MQSNQTSVPSSWALITGASSGIGKCYAQFLAATGRNLVLTARRADALAALGRSLESAHGIRTLSVPKDLSVPTSAAEIYREVTAQGIEVDLLINNAGFGEYGLIHEVSLESNQRMIQLNVVALAALTQSFLEPMVTRKRGTIINVASTAAFQPLPYMATYAATKAFVLSFTEALWAEYRHRGVRVLAVCPGATDTEFFDHHSSPDAAVVGAKETPEAVVRQTFQALAKDAPSVITGSFTNRFLANLSRLLTRKRAVLTAEKVMAPKSPPR